MANTRTSRRVCACSRGGSVSRVLSDWPILPISLRAPVAVTSPMPVPRTTSEPENTYGRSSPPGRRAFRRSVIGTGDLAHGHGLARQQRFIGLQVVTLNEHCVGRHPVALGKHDEIATHHLPAGDSFALAIANDQRTRTGEIAQRLQDALGAGLLHDRDHDRHGREGEQDERFLQVAERQIDHAAAEQQRQHRLAQHLEDDAQRRAPIRPGQLVVSLGLQPGLSVRLAEAADRGER